jgi:cyanophycinase-like exopeptidase
VLLGPDGRDLAVLAAIREAHAAGAAIGGSSAGAAIMSDPMLVGGDSLGALRFGAAPAAGRRPNQESGIVEFSKGFGFFPFGLIDQHFDMKARQARLVAALRATGVDRGYGIDEDTALIVDFASGTGEIAGRGGVTILDVSGATFGRDRRPFSVENVRVDLLTPGDRIHFGDRWIEVGPGRKATIGNEYHRVAEVVQGGVLASYGTFRAVAGHLLLDNSEMSRVESLVVGSGGESWRVLLRQDRRTEGWWL